MCLAVPAKVLEIKGNHAVVDFGGGIVKEINVSLVDVKVGEYVIVHAGFAIQVMDEKSAEESLQVWKEILETER
ncbi:HypC/HybG/HupF family hydrogenase formation chaperone [Candidatus Bathyarchaeota archaeon]|nr:MAG: HypC/HybG/HupF family hydrogenase formation chaperone [Candidatus Bathyarchaeota archaeon]